MNSAFNIGLTDAFGKPISDITTSNMTLAGHYPYSPERWRILLDDVNQFPEYNSVPQYNHNEDIHELKPNAGETVVFQTAERPRYVVQYEQIISFAFSINQQLQSGDRIRIGMFDGQDGWFMEHNSTHKSKQVDMVVLRNGSELVRKTGNVKNDFTTFCRLELRTNWYNVGRQLWKYTYTYKGQQRNDTIGKTSIDNARGPRTGNLNLRYEITAGSSTNNLILNAGSIGFVTLGNVSPIKRVKGLHRTRNIATTDTWVPIDTFRIDPNRKIISTQITDIDAIDFDGTGLAELVAQIFHQDNITYSGSDNWRYPNELSSTNNVIQYRNDPSTFYDNDGNSVSNASNIGGYQLGRSLLSVSQQGNSKSVKPGGTENIKRQLHEDAIMLILANVSSTGNLTYEVSFEQEW